MSSTSIQNAAAEPAPLPPRPTRPAARRDAGPVRRVLYAVASLRVTVVLFVLSLVLVFVGTLAQVDASNHVVVRQYFRSLYVWVPWQLLVHFGQVFFGLSENLSVGGAFPFPGGWLLGGLLLVNLLAAHLVRFRLGWKRSGILLIHSGLVLMMLGELVTGLLAVEGQMTIVQGGTSSYLEDPDKVELALVDASDPKVDDVVAVPGSMLREGATVRHDGLPFAVRVDKYMTNSRLGEGPPAGANPATAGAGLTSWAEELPPGTGTDTDNKSDAPSAYVTLLDKAGGGPLGTYLLSAWLRPQQVTVGGKTYQVDLRRTRMYKPYTVQLLKFDHKVYMGTSTPKDFRSTVLLTDPTRGEERRAEIYMNHPLRYQGETFYQQSFLKGDQGTVLQVVQNPGWLMPYLSCAVVCLGMAVHFGIHLYGFLQRRAAA
jgi:hypothetical protein